MRKCTCEEYVNCQVRKCTCEENVRCLVIALGAQNILILKRDLQKPGFRKEYTCDINCQK